MKHAESVTCAQVVEHLVVVVKKEKEKGYWGVLLVVC